MMVSETLKGCLRLRSGRVICCGETDTTQTNERVNGERGLPGTFNEPLRVSRRNLVNLDLGYKRPRHADFKNRR